MTSPSDPTPTTEACGHIFTDGSRCHLAAGHNMGKADIPANHAKATDQTPQTEDGYDDKVLSDYGLGPDGRPDQTPRTEAGPYPRLDVQEYRKTATVMAGQAPTGGVIPTLEGDHTYEAGDYIAGPGAAGEYWPACS